ncbi:hypothetical protein E3N88_14079 [Mikania micrantha]|uniref:Uncharacterized protein n=1 Tax=Mikania micrantha TaxID=192012 RepID=A0A5N6P0G2_9ASTR|nr:hypothetical protein E3N88_14079 [Mikania micrantha]
MVMKNTIKNGSYPPKIFSDVRTRVFNLCIALSSRRGFKELNVFECLQDYWKCWSSKGRERRLTSCYCDGVVVKRVERAIEIKRQQKEATAPELLNHRVPTMLCRSNDGGGSDEHGGLRWTAHNPLGDGSRRI